MTAIRAGDDRAFEALWQRYHRRIAAYVNGMVNDHARAEDITQDVFMSALRRIRETDRAIAFKPWIYEIAKNACIDAFRRSRRAEEVSYHAEAGLASADQVRLVSSSPTPEVAVDQRMSLDNLRGAFGGLSDTHHDILVMRELEGLSYREIGERLGMSRPSVESTLFRARRRLSEEYEELVSGERCRRVQGMMLDATAATLGTRDARRMSKHVSHCSGCRRQAAIAGFDIAELTPRPLRQRVAALLPLPAFLRKRFGGADEAAAVATVHPAAAQWATSLVGQYVEPAALSGWAKAAAAAATIAMAGVGAGAASDPERMGFGGRDEAVAPVGDRDGADAPARGGAVAGATGGAAARAGDAPSRHATSRARAGTGTSAGGATASSGRGGASGGDTAGGTSPGRDLVPRVDLRPGTGSAPSGAPAGATQASSGGSGIDGLHAGQQAPSPGATASSPSLPSAGTSAPTVSAPAASSGTASTSLGEQAPPATPAAQGAATGALPDPRTSDVGGSVQEAGTGTSASTER